MAWQNSIGMGPGSGGSATGSNEPGGNGGQPQGTEYTLQGEHATQPLQFTTISGVYRNQTAAKMNI